jgi:signal transduction histidine kinase
MRKRANARPRGPKKRAAAGAQRLLQKARLQLEQANARLAQSNEELITANEELVTANEELLQANRQLLLETEQRSCAERSLRSEKDAVENTVREKTLQLTAAWHELEQNSRLCDIGSLAATVAHELRNPLAAISMAARNIARKASGADIAAQLANISKKIAESDQIISNLLFYSRLRPPRFEKVPLRELVSDSISACLYKSKKPIAVLRELDALDSLTIEGDAVQLAELFCNIIGNACDAVPPARGEIRVTAEAGRESVLLRVEDNGPGIAPEIAGRIFDPFFTTKARGTGLGLALCKQIVAMHGGELGVGRATAGAVLYVRLPLLRPPAAGAA